MALSREQYDRINGILGDRRRTAVRNAEKRQEEAYERLPALKLIEEELQECRSRLVRAGLRDPGQCPEIEKELEKLLKKREGLLSEAGLSSAYLEVHYSCPDCGDTGYLGNEKCGCRRKLESELINSAAGLPELLSRENFGTFRLDVFDDREPLREMLPTGRKITQREYMREVILPEAKRFAEGFGKLRIGGIVMSGGAGTGKTFLTNCIARELIERQHSVLYMTAGDLFEMLQKNDFRKEPGEEDSRVDALNRAELLIIDDLGSEFSNTYTVARLFGIISHRLSVGLSTIISTNLSLNQIGTVYGERVVSRLYGDFLKMHFFGRDIRMNKERR